MSLGPLQNGKCVSLLPDLLLYGRFTTSSASFPSTRLPLSPETRSLSTSHLPPGVRGWRRDTHHKRVGKGGALVTCHTEKRARRLPPALLLWVLAAINQI